MSACNTADQSRNCDQRNGPHAHFCSAASKMRLCLRWVKTGKARYEHMFSGLPLSSIHARSTRCGCLPPSGLTVSLSRLLDSWTTSTDFAFFSQAYQESQWSWMLVTLLERQFIRQLFFQSFGCLPRFLRSSCEPHRRPLSEIWWPSPLVLAC